MEANLKNITAIVVSVLLICVLVPMGLHTLANANMTVSTTPPSYENYTVLDVSVPPAGNNYSFAVNCASELATSVASWDFTVHITELVADVNDYTVSIHVNHGVNATNFDTYTLGAGDETHHIYLTHIGVTTGSAVVYIYVTDWNDSLVGEFLGTVTVQVDPTPTVTVAVDNTVQLILLVLVPLLAVVGLAWLFVREFY